MLLLNFMQRGNSCKLVLPYVPFVKITPLLPQMDDRLSSHISRKASLWVMSQTVERSLRTDSSCRELVKSDECGLRQFFFFLKAVFLFTCAWFYCVWPKSTFYVPMWNRSDYFSWMCKQENNNIFFLNLFWATFICGNSSDRNQKFAHVIIIWESGQTLLHLSSFYLQSNSEAGKC